MMTFRRAAAAALALVAMAPVSVAAQTIIPLPKFKTIELRGGGKVTVRPGATQRVTLVKGSTQFTSLEVREREVRRVGRNTVINNDERLVISACNARCPRRYDMEVVIETPDVEALAVHGGGKIDIRQGFAPQQNVAVAVNGGGQIDARAFPVSNVAASVNGGGLLLVQPRTALAASVRGGGEVRYWGSPAVSTSISGGGSVRRQR